ncbi:MAG TPA: NADH-quinone oxidoreductase subunit C [Candidatus Acidoferrales bacterium]|nr:NADH-quinone oxidoreductase subunit C [Candidatus Acidoferrales bacterium]
MANDPSEKDPVSKPPASGAEDKPVAKKPTEPAQAGSVTANPSVPPDAPAKKPAEPSAAVPATPAVPGAPAAKPAAPAAPAAPKAAAPPAKEAPPKPLPLDNELVQRLKARFGDAIREATLDRKQAIITIAADQLREVSRYCRDEEKFDMLVDLTAVDWPKREKRFDVILILYSFAKNERVRLKAHAGENEPVPSACEIWPAANWLERECYDMFGIVFEGHPKLTRILMPDEWQGYPLRKDYDILKQDTDWVRENLGIESGQ